MKKCLIAALALFLILAVSVAADEPDSLWIGHLYAYHVTGDVFKVPLYYSNDGVLTALGFPLKFISTGGPIYPDSLTRAGRTFGTNLFNLFFGFSSGEFGGNPDSACVGMIGFDGDVPPGDGVIADCWFSGAQVGDLISFLPAETYPPACTPGANPGNPPGEFVFVPTALVVAEGVTEIVCQTAVEGMATHTVSFPIFIYGSNGPFSLEIVSFEGPEPPQFGPTLSGSDPWNFVWVPGFNDVGEYTLTLRATDGLDETVDAVVTIDVAPLNIDPCDVARGDLNCDGKVDIADLIFMVDWMFTDGPAPYCK